MNLRSKQFLLITIVLFVNTVIAQDTWTWTQRYSGPRHLNDVAAGADGLFAAVGNEGAILTSPDGIEWTERNSNTYHGLHTVIWGDGMFVAGGDSGIIVTSVDGVEWVVRRSGGSTIRSIAWGNGKYVASIARALHILISDDGIEWIEQTISGNGIVYNAHLVYGDGLFMAAYDDCYVPVSTDGVNWRLENDDILRGRGPIFYFFECNNCYYYPPNNLACMPACGVVHSIAYGNGIFLLSGQVPGRGGYPKGLARYERGSVWEIIDYDCDWSGRRSINGYSIIYGETRFVIAGSNGIYFTENGDVFELISTKSLRRGVSMAYDGSVYVTVYGTEIGTLSEGFSSILNPRHTAKFTSNFTLHQNDRLLKITLSNKNLRPQIAIFNLAGKRQKVKLTFHTDGMISVSLSNLATGMYILRIDSGKESWQRQVMVR